uniref:Neurotoxin LmNaTx14 n=1 Tax=Lychas mucronatus TaxID=172552 RepID=A0A0U1SBV9_LYCMC|nr:neurotoxin LmNaTx14 precursor [Lychas mucronatus]
MQLKIQLLMLVLMIVLTGVHGKDGYVVHKDTNCKYSCSIFNKWKYCSPLCQKKGAKTGYCNSFACWCVNLPEETIVYGDKGTYCWE